MYYTPITFFHNFHSENLIILSKIQNIKFWIWLEVVWIYQKHCKPNISEVRPHISASGDRSILKKKMFSYLFMFFVCNGRYEKIDRFVDKFYKNSYNTIDRHKSKKRASVATTWDVYEHFIVFKIIIFPSA